MGREQLSNKFNQIKSIDFKGRVPFDYAIIDNFLSEKTLKSIISEFPDYESEEWHIYKNAIENKKTLNNWNRFGAETYRLFEYLNSNEFISKIEKVLDLNVELFPDYGLNGGGLHIHGKGGTLNPHLDYNIHPKNGKQRKLNIIIYLSELTEDDEESNQGALGLWKGNEKSTLEIKPEVIVKPKINRAIIFDTTQNSWHGMVESMNKISTHRKSLAIYYLVEAPENTEYRYKALFSPYEHQSGDKNIEELIKKRSDINFASEVYKYEK